VFQPIHFVTEFVEHVVAAPLIRQSVSESINDEVHDEEKEGDGLLLTMDTKVVSLKKRAPLLNSVIGRRSH
jgi:hypothetical protein